MHHALDTAALPHLTCHTYIATSRVPHLHRHISHAMLTLPHLTCHTYTSTSHVPYLHCHNLPRLHCQILQLHRTCDTHTEVGGGLLTSRRTCDRQREVWGVLTSGRTCDRQREVWGYTQVEEHVTERGMGGTHK